MGEDGQEGLGEATIHADASGGGGPVSLRCDLCGVVLAHAEADRYGGLGVTRVCHKRTADPEAERLLDEHVGGKVGDDWTAGWLSIMDEVGVDEAERLFFGRHLHASGDVFALTECAKCHSVLEEVGRRRECQDLNTWSGLVDAFDALLMDDPDCVVCEGSLCDYCDLRGDAPDPVCFPYSAVEGCLPEAVRVARDAGSDVILLREGDVPMELSWRPRFDLDLPQGPVPTATACGGQAA